MQSSITLAARVYRFLLYLYPSGFRRSHGGDMALDFVDASFDAGAVRGWRGVGRHWIRAFADLVTTVVEQWLRTGLPLVGAIAVCVSTLGWIVATRWVPHRAAVLRVDPHQEELYLLLLFIIAVLIPVAGVIVFCCCFVMPLVRRAPPRRRV